MYAFMTISSESFLKTYESSSAKPDPGSDNLIKLSELTEPTIIRISKLNIFESNFDKKIFFLILKKILKKNFKKKFEKNLKKNFF